MASSGQAEPVTNSNPSSERTVAPMEAQPDVLPGGEPAPGRRARSNSGSSSSSSSSGASFDSKMHKVHGSELPLGWRHMFRMPVVRQWIGPARDGSSPILYKSPEERTVDKVDLIFDLIFVGLIHVLAENAITPITPLNIGIFILTFYPAYNLWRESRDFGNQSGVDDVIQRIYVLCMMILLIGYGSNAAAIRVTPLEAGAEGEVPEGENPNQTGENTGMEEEIEPGTLVAGPYGLGEGAYEAIQAATAFFLVAKLLRLIVYIAYASYLKTFRRSLLANATSSFIMSLFYFPILFTRNNTAIIVLAGVGQYMGTYFKIVLGLIADIDKYQQAIGLGRHGFLIAKSLEHQIERNTQFTMVVIGEMIINSFYIPRPNQIGLHSEYGRSVFGVILAFCIALMYFDADSCRVFRHALRAKWSRSLHWDALHHPMAGGLIIASASMSTIIAEDIPNIGARWNFGGGLAMAIFSITCQGLLHEARDKPGSSLVPRWARFVVRFGVVVIFATLPLANNLNGLAMLGTYTGILALTSIFELIGKMGLEAMDDHKDGIANVRTREEKDPEKQAAGAGANGQTDLEAGVQRRMTRVDTERGPARAHRIKDRHGHVSTMRGEDVLDEKKSQKLHIHHEERLTGHELGADDVGLDSNLGEVIGVRIKMKQVLAYAA